MAITEGKMEVRSRSPGAVVLEQKDFDDATGVNGEDSVRELMRQATDSNSNS